MAARKQGLRGEILLEIARSDDSLDAQAKRARRSSAQWRQIRSSLVLCGIIQPASGGFNEDRDAEIRAEWCRLKALEPEGGDSAAAVLAEKHGLTEGRIRRIVQAGS